MFTYFWDRDRAWAGEGQRERETQNPKQAPGSELSAKSPTWVWNPWTCLSHSWMLHRLSHPGTLQLRFLIWIEFRESELRWKNITPLFLLICNWNLAFTYECRKQATVVLAIICGFISNQNTCFFLSHISLQLSWNTVYIHELHWNYSTFNTLLHLKKFFF